MPFTPLTPPPAGDRLQYLVRKLDEMLAELYSWLAEPLRNIGYGLKTIYPGSSGVVQLDFLTTYYQTLNVNQDVNFAALNLATGRSLSVRLTNTTDSSYLLAFPTGTRFVGHLPQAVSPQCHALLTLTAYGTHDTDLLATYQEQLDPPAAP